MEKKTPLFKVGFYQVSEIKNGLSKSYEVDNGQYIFIERLKKYIVNKNRDKKRFKSLDKAKDYAALKLVNHNKTKEKKLSKIPKSLYLVLIKEETTGKTFVKVGITSKRFIMRRFSKAYGYEGYTLESILRRIDTPDAESLENKIKEKLNKKRSVKKYRPILESFSGYSECFNYDCLSDIIKVFDDLTKTT
jgi:DNA-binding Lrp family transcriptional regulator